MKSSAQLKRSSPNPRFGIFRMKEEEKDVETKIRDLINGLHYIPIYKEFDLAGPSILGQSEKKLNPIYIEPNKM